MVRALHVALERLPAELLRRCPTTVPPWVRGATRALAVAAVPAVILLVVSPLLAHPWTFGQHNWDQMETQRAFVVKSILRFHQLPLWDPYECGGHPAWGSLESDPIVVSPWLPAYLLAPLPLAIRFEIIASACWGAVGCWLLASRFTSSTAVRALFAVAIAVNSRWALQIAVGHTWHLLYGTVPWVFFLFDRALDPGRAPRAARADLALAALALAAMVYGDAIYPVPHAAFALTVYAAVVARGRRSWAPLGALALCGSLAVGLAGPKLLPLYATMQRFPRWIHSGEVVAPWTLVRAMTWRVGDFTATTSFTHGMWHEWGLYLGWLGLAGLVAGVLASRGVRERGLKWAGLLMLSMVIGAVPLGPWSLLHHLPIFKSQHAPSRWMYPAVMLLACAAASGAERWLERAGPRRALLEAVLGGLAAVLALDLGLVAREPIARSFVDPVPALSDEAPPFHVVHRLPPRADYRPCLWDIATLPAVLGNVGTLECDTDNGLHSTLRDEAGRMPGLGAFGDTDPDYRGEAYVAERAAAGQVLTWTPSEVAVRFDGAQPGDHLVLNQNWDPGWSANGAPAVAYRDATAAVARAAGETVTFRYRPPLLGWGLALLGLTLGALAWLLRRSPRGRAS